MVVGEGKRRRITVLGGFGGADGGARAVLVMRGYGKSGGGGWRESKGAVLGWSRGYALSFGFLGVTSQTQKFYVPSVAGHFFNQTLNSSALVPRIIQ